MLLDFDLCFLVLDMNTRSYLSLKRLRIIMRKEVDDSDIEGVIFVHAYTQEFIRGVSNLWQLAMFRYKYVILCHSQTTFKVGA